MGLAWVQVSLRGYGGAEPTGTTFFELLGLQHGDDFSTSPSDSAWKAASVELVEVAMDHCRDTPEPTAEFVARMDAGLRRAASWLQARPPQLFEQWRRVGRKTDVFVGGWLEVEQLDLSFPPEFLLACGRLGLPMVICTND